MLKNLNIILLSIFTLIGFSFPAPKAESIAENYFWMKIRAKDQFERSWIANQGVAIEVVREDFVVAYGDLAQKTLMEKSGRLEVSIPMAQLMDFPNQDRDFHNYSEVKDELAQLVKQFPTLAQGFSIGRSVEGREILGIRISRDLAQADTKPGTIFMGGHHAREHLSVEVPLRLARHILEQYQAGDSKITHLVNSRDIHIIPAVNPDGLEYDISTGQYKYWRKNRHSNSDGTYGVDLNRNYGFGWGTGGSSKSPSSDVYMGPAPFSEPETQAVKKYVESHTNLTILLSFHTFSELILYPWGHKYDKISDNRDLGVFETMAHNMAQMNGYTPEQSSALYIASGDTTDWAYGEHKMFAFTFELDPANQMDPGGFYPGAGVINSVVAKNIDPCLYLLEYSDNPYRVLSFGGGR